MPAFHGIFIDIGDEQSLQQSLSTFSAHLTRQLDMLRRAGPTTLLLFDELGAGTDPDEGAAIGRAILDDLLRLRARCIVTTHLGALKGFALTRPRAENGRVEFDIETLRPTYHLRIGEAGSSNAIDIAQRLGMPRRLVQASRFNLSRKARALRAAIEGTDVAKRQAEDARRAAETARADAARAAGAADEAKARYEAEQAAFQQWLQHVVHLQPGARCRVRHVDTEGQVVRMRLDKQRAEVAVGAMLIEVPLGDLLPPDVPAPPPRPPRPPRTEPPPQSRERRPRAEGPPPRDRRPHPGHPARGDVRPPRGDHREHGARPRPERREPEPAWRPLSDRDAESLTAGSQVIAKRFHRPATIVRVNAAKKVAVVTVGLLEVEVPFSGLGLPAEPAPPRPAPPVVAVQGTNIPPGSPSNAEAAALAQAESAPAEAAALSAATADLPAATTQSGETKAAEQVSPTPMLDPQATPAVPDVPS
jgi:dsDNA-specific endonuclease/ATPase MutS2